MVKKFLILFVCLLFLSACAKNEVKKSVSPDSQLTGEAYALLEKVMEAYVKRDITALKTNATAEGYREIMGSVKEFDAAELSFVPRWVEINKEGGVILNFSWTGKWTLKGAVIEEKGMAVFLLEGKPLKLSRILKGSPFIYPE